MIERLHGTLLEKSIGSIIIDANGVGYGLRIPLSTYYILPDSDDHVSLHVHTHMKEDGIQLFGFATKEEREIFQRLLKIRGVGPKLSLNILSYLPAEDMSSALEGINFEVLVKIPGVGKKMAERILFELKGIIEREGKGAKEPEAGVIKEAKSALANLGFHASQSEKLLKELWNEDKSVSLEALVRKSLKRLTRI